MQIDFPPVNTETWELNNLFTGAANHYLYGDRMKPLNASVAAITDMLAAGHAPIDVRHAAQRWLHKNDK
ncbi:hypothetical protein [Amycolatopsis sp. DSM 110486]|uniref:hypothetical protein n=1 Tax=Amycolatopsis sp. DSM 110486 TaxID=2865832 RepID=UPI001C699C3F|nr:hypothetical protein [Amycolatopsis sp. DSM 110486]QYN17484.1 hypothetical protein K1T34_32380 [Amycolatopsis sp. DSM 110486]